MTKTCGGVFVMKCCIYKLLASIVDCGAEISLALSGFWEILIYLPLLPFPVLLLGFGSLVLLDSDDL
jgi:hypothetical protein